MEKTQKQQQQDILGTGSEYVSQELDKISNISKESTVITNTNDNTIVKKIDWNNIYGKLKNDEYKLVLSSDSFGININFRIDESGKITYDTPEII